jgi:hypothetical protein
MWIFKLIEHLDVLQLNIEILVYTFERPADRNIVLELDGDFVVDEGLEEAVQ